MSHRAFGPSRGAGEISIQNVFSMREMVVDCLLRDLNPVMGRRGNYTGHNHSEPVMFTSSSSNNNIARLEEELSIVKRSLIASEAENRILRKHVGDAYGEQNPFHHHRQSEGHASSSSRIVTTAKPSASPYDAETVYWENVLLKMKIKRWRKFVKAAQCRRTKLQKNMKSLQGEVRQLKLLKGPESSQAKDFGEKIQALESQVSRLTGMLTADFSQAKQGRKGAHHHDMGLDRSQDHLDQVLTHTPTKTKYDDPNTQYYGGAPNRKTYATRSAADPFLNSSSSRGSDAFRRKVRVDLVPTTARRGSEMRPSSVHGGSRIITGTAGLKQALTDVESSQKSMMLDFARNTKGLQDEVEALLDKYHFERNRKAKRVSWKD